MSSTESTTPVCWRTGPKGALGGADGGVNKVVVTYQDGETFIPPHLSKAQDILINPGDSITVCTPGGGGFGDPRMRDPKLIERDLRRGYYTAEEIAEKFG